MTEKTVETPKAPIYLQPTVQLVNATLQEVQDSLAWQAKQDRGLSEGQKGLSKVLSSVVYDGVQVTASNLRQALEPFSKESIGYAKDSKFKGLVADLEYVELLEKGGLEAVNGKVKELFESLGTEMTYEQRREVMGKINDILGRAIYLFPHLAKGVEVRLKPETEQKTEEFEERYGLDYYRNRYNMLLEVYQQKKGVTLLDALTIPLPYGFTTGTHGSGERAAMGASWEDVYLDFIHPRGDYQTRVPALAVALEAPLIIVHPSYFTLDEVESIQFTDKGEFVPYVDKRHGEDVLDVLIEKGTPETYYLRFRNFSGVGGALRERKHLMELTDELTDEQWKRCNRELVTARPFTNLWEEDYYTKPRALKKGFMASWGDDPHNVTMYEVTNVGLPRYRYNSEEAAAVLYIKILKDDKGVLSHIKQYKGNNIIRRLLEIPVAERNF